MREMLRVSHDSNKTPAKSKLWFGQCRPSIPNQVIPPACFSLSDIAGWLFSQLFGLRSVEQAVYPSIAFLPLLLRNGLLAPASALPSSGCCRQRSRRVRPGGRKRSRYVEEMGLV